MTMNDPVEVMARAIVSFEARDEGAPFPPRVTEHDRDKARSALAAAESAGMVMVERKVIELAADRMDVAASRVDRADTEFGFRVWAQELRASLAQQEKP